MLACLITLGVLFLLWLSGALYIVWLVRLNKVRRKLGLEDHHPSLFGFMFVE